MGRTTFLLLAVAYYIITIIILIVILNLLNRKEKNKLKNQIDELEKEKNLIISASMLSELNKVEALVNNDEMRLKLDDWKKDLTILKMLNCLR